MYKQLTREQRYAIYLRLQKKDIHCYCSADMVIFFAILLIFTFKKVETQHNVRHVVSTAGMVERCAVVAFADSLHLG